MVSFEHASIMDLLILFVNFLTGQHFFFQILTELLIFNFFVKDVEFSSRWIDYITTPLRNPILAYELGLYLSVMLVVNPSEQHCIFELWDRVIEPSLLFELLIANQSICLIFEFIDPRLFLKAWNTIRKGFLLSPKNLFRKESRESDINCLPEMVFFDSVTRTLDVGG